MRRGTIETIELEAKTLVEQPKKIGSFRCVSVHLHPNGETIAAVLKITSNGGVGWRCFIVISDREKKRPGDKYLGTVFKNSAPLHVHERVEWLGELDENDELIQ